MNDLDLAFSKISKNMKFGDVKSKKRKCKKCGYPLSLIGNTLLCMRCGHEEAF